AAVTSLLVVFPQPFMHSLGIAGGVTGLLAGLIALLVLPALFGLLGTRVNALSTGRRPGAEPTRGWWYRIARLVTRRPLPVALAPGALLLVLAAPSLSLRFIGVDASVLPPGSSAYAVDAVLRRDFSSDADPSVYAVVRGDESDAEAYANAALELPHAG